MPCSYLAASSPNYYCNHWARSHHFRFAAGGEREVRVVTAWKPTSSSMAQLCAVLRCRQLCYDGGTRFSTVLRLWLLVLYGCRRGVGEQLLRLRWTRRECGLLALDQDQQLLKEFDEYLQKMKTGEFYFRKGLTSFFFATFC